MNDRPYSPAMPRVVFGLILVTLGTLLTLSQLGYDLDAVFEYWPVALIVLGLAKLSSGRWPSGFFWILAGSILLIPRLSDRLDFDDLWPLLLVLIGLRVVWRSVGGEPAATAEPDDTIKLFAFFTSRKHRVESRAFRGGEVTAVLGGCEVDLSAARLAEGYAGLDVLAFWGGVSLRVPEDWVVSLKATPVMGGAEDSRTPPAPAAESEVEVIDGEPKPDRGRPHLVVRGLALMGGVEVRT